MTTVLQHAVSPFERTAVATKPVAQSDLQTEAVSVIYTSFDDTFAAARVGADLAAKMGVPLRVVHFRTVPRQLDIDHPDGLSPVETEAFTSRLVDAGISARVRVYLCRDEEKTIPFAFKPHSIVVIGGHHSWLPTHVERLRHAIEDAGHFVVLVDPSEHKEHVHA